MGKSHTGSPIHGDYQTDNPTPKQTLTFDQSSIKSSKSGQSNMDPQLTQPLFSNLQPPSKTQNSRTCDALSSLMSISNCTTTVILPPNERSDNVPSHNPELDEQRHLAMTGECFRTMYNKNILTDVTIKVADEEFQAHRAVLIAHSQRLREYIIHKDAQEPVELKIAGLPSEPFKIILDYLYSGDLVITLENIADLHCAGQQLAIKSLLERCEMKLKNMDAHDALIILHTAFNKESEICGRAFKVVVKAFQEVRDSPEMMVQQISMLMIIIGSDKLVVEKEMDVFRAAMAWLHYESSRLEYANEVLGQIRFCYMTARDLMVSNELMRGKHTDLDKYMLDSMWFAMARQFECESKMDITLYPKRQYTQDPANAPRNDTHLTMEGYVDIGLENGGRQQLTWRTQKRKITTIKRKKRSDGKYEKAIVIVGGLNAPNNPDEAIGKFIYAYTPHNETWRKVGELPEARHLHGVVFSMECLFIVGGASPTDPEDPMPVPTSTMYKWELKTNEWTACTMMTNRRMLHSVTKLNTRIYAIGGQAECTRMLKSVEVYNPTLNRWDDVAPLTVGRMGMGVTSHRGKILVVGGYSDICTNTSGAPVMSAVELYEPATNSWTVLRDLPSPRFHSALLEFEGQIYMCGGATREEKEEEPPEKKATNPLDGKIEEEEVGMLSVASIEKYNDNMDRWNQVSILNYPRHGAAVALIANKIFIMGGVSTTEEGTVNKVESLDMITGLRHCSNLGCPAQMGMGVAVIDAGILDGEQFKVYDVSSEEEEEEEVVDATAAKNAEKQMSIKF